MSPSQTLKSHSQLFPSFSPIGPTRCCFCLRNVSITTDAALVQSLFPVSCHSYLQALLLPLLQSQFYTFCTTLSNSYTSACIPYMPLYYSTHHICGNYLRKRGSVLNRLFFNVQVHPVSPPPVRKNIPCISMVPRVKSIDPHSFSDWKRSQQTSGPMCKGLFLKLWKFTIRYFRVTQYFYYP